MLVDKTSKNQTDGGAGGTSAGGGLVGAVGKKRSVVYGATEMLTGAEFVGQLGALGRKTGH